jgi:hypothetical protein
VLVVRSEDLVALFEIQPRKDPGNSVEYEGPSLEIDSKDIASAIWGLTNHADSLSIDAHYFPTSIDSTAENSSI